MFLEDFPTDSQSFVAKTDNSSNEIRRTTNSPSHVDQTFVCGDRHQHRPDNRGEIAVNESVEKSETTNTESKSDARF